jgi:hypothetical protein
MKDCDWMIEDRTCTWDNTKDVCELVDKNGKCTFEPNKYMYCSCGFNCKTMSELRNHRNNHLPWCKICKKTFTNPAKAFAHALFSECSK